METLTRFTWPHSPFRDFVAGSQARKRLMRVSAVETERHSERMTPEECVMSFLNARRDTGDFISKASDLLWRSELSTGNVDEISKRLARIQKLEDSDYLSRRAEASGTINQALLRREKEKDEFRRKGLLEYEALKRELSLVTAAIGTACGVYCLAVFSAEAAVSYELGVLGSLLYLQILGFQVDKTSKENVPEIFLEGRKRKRIGITTRDLQESFEKNFQGIRLALSSPRLLLPIALYSLWAATKQLHQDALNLQVGPMMLGFFAYKAAALVQAYRDNQGLLITFPAEDEEHLDD